MLIVIPIQDIWKRYVEDSRALSGMGVSVQDVVMLAFGYAALSCQTAPVQVSHHGGEDIFRTVRNLLIDRLPLTNRLPFTRQSAYGDNDAMVYRVVDIVGEISQMLADAVINQLGSFPPTLRLLRFIGPDLVLTTNEEHREFLRHCLTQDRPERPQ